MNELQFVCSRAPQETSDWIHCAAMADEAIDSLLQEGIQAAAKVLQQTQQMMHFLTMQRRLA